jgi:hypothetical protein
MPKKSKKNKISKITKKNPFTKCSDDELFFARHYNLEMIRACEHQLQQIHEVSTKRYLEEQRKAKTTYGK